MTQEAVIKPLKKIATLTVCWLEYNARSLNGRIYPTATCDAIYTAALVKLADPNSLPITCFTSHETANGNVNTSLVGRVARIWQEGVKFFANIDLADTIEARDMLALAEGGYLASESMRVLGVKLVMDNAYDLPVVVPEDGYAPELLGIDLTTRPGLQDTARILAVLYESAAPESRQPYSEAFACATVSIEALKGAEPMSIPLYLKVVAETMDEAMTADRKAHQVVHDHLAGVLDATIAAKHGNESASFMTLVEAELSEDGRAIARKNAVKIAAAHDASAESLGMECAGCYNDVLGVPMDPDQDGVPDDQDPTDNNPDNPTDGAESVAVITPPFRGGTDDMTPQEMMDALKAQGYAIEAPKSAEQQLQESFDAKIAALEAKFATLTESRATAPPQRQSQALSSISEGGLAPEAMYEEGDHLLGDLKPTNWKSLGSRRTPWPVSVDPAQALHELTPFLTHRLLEQEAHAQGRAIDAFIQPYEQI